MAGCLEENLLVMWHSTGLALISNKENSVSSVAGRRLWRPAYMSLIGVCGTEASSRLSATEATKLLKPIFSILPCT